MLLSQPLLVCTVAIGSHSDFIVLWWLCKLCIYADSSTYHRRPKVTLIRSSQKGFLLLHTILVLNYFPIISSSLFPQPRNSFIGHLIDDIDHTFQPFIESKLDNSTEVYHWRADGEAERFVWLAIDQERWLCDSDASLWVLRSRKYLQEDHFWWLSEQWKSVIDQPSATKRNRTSVPFYCLTNC